MIIKKNKYINCDAYLGFTLIEQITVVLVMSILLLAATPSFISFTNKNMLKNAAENLASDLHWIRSEVMTYGSLSDQSINIVFSINSSSWCYGFTVKSYCDCTKPLGDDDECTLSDSGSAQLKVINSNKYSGKISMSNLTFASNSTHFNSVRGLSSIGGVTLNDNQGRSIDIRVNPMGRVHVCSSTHAEQLGYPAC